MKTIMLRLAAAFSLALAGFANAQAPSTANIGAGLINNTSIGQTTPAPGNFSSLTINGAPVGTASGNMPAAGASGQLLKKNSSTNYDASWTTPGTAWLVNTGTSAGTLCLLNASCSWSALQAYTAGLTVGSSAAASTQSLILQSAAGQVRRLEWKSGTTARWDLYATSTAETGNNAGSALSAFAYTDAGAVAGTLFQGERASGPSGAGKPYFSIMAAAEHNQSRAAIPNGTVGDHFTYTDVQPTVTLGASPLATTNGSPNVVITWMANQLNTSSNVFISGTTAICGLTPSGWYRISAVATNTVTINAGSNASCTGTGGGSSVTAQREVSTAGVRFDEVVTSAAGDFNDGWVQYFDVEPSHYITSASGLNPPNYEAMFIAGLSPSDNSGLNGWGLATAEMDTVNRGRDEGYQPTISSAPRFTLGLLLATENLSQFVGNEGVNATVAGLCAHSLHPNSSGFPPKWYQCWAGVPDALVSNSAAGGHGGIFIDGPGAKEDLAAGAFATTSGSAVVAVTFSNATGNLTTAHNNPTSLFLPTAITVGGTTCAAGDHTGAVLLSETFQITCTGNATSTTTGGAATWASFSTDVPYAPAQFPGEYSRGILMPGRVDSGAALDGASGTFVNGVDFSAATVSGSPFKSVGYNVDNAGNVSATSVTAPGVVKPYTWATLPAASSNSHVVAEVTDVGYGGSLWVSDGSVWHPVGPITLGRSAVAQTVSSTTTETTLATVAVPAGAMALNHRLAIDMVWSFTGSTNQKTMRAKFGGTTFIQSLTTTAANVAFRGGGNIANRGSASSQVAPVTTLNGGTGFSNTAVVTGAVDTTSAQNVTITALMASGAETMTLESYEVRLLP